MFGPLKLKMFGPLKLKMFGPLKLNTKSTNGLAWEQLCAALPLSCPHVLKKYTNAINAPIIIH